MNNPGSDFKPELKVENEAELRSDTLADFGSEHSLVSNDPLEQNSNEESGFDSNGNVAEIISDDYESYASVEAYRKKVEKQRKISQVCLIVFFIILAGFSSVILYPRITITDETLGISPSVYQVRTSAAPSYEEDWRVLWDNYVRYYEPSFIERHPEVRSWDLCRRHKEALKIASEVAAKHDWQFVEAELAKASSLRQLASLSAKDDKELVTKLEWERYYINRKMLGKSHPCTLDALYDCLGLTSSTQGTARAHAMAQEGLRLSREAFPEGRDTFQLVWLFSRSLGLPAEQNPEHGTDQIENQERSIRGLLASGRYKQANKQYSQLLKEVAWKYGENSSKFRCVADCFCTTLEAEGLTEEANRIRAKSHVPRDSDRGLVK